MGSNLIANPIVWAGLVLLVSPLLSAAGTFIYMDFFPWIGKQKTAVTILLYILIALFTNAYVQTHRYADWYRESTGRDPVSRESQASVKVAIATLAWPVYWTTTGFTYLLEDDSQQENACACGNCSRKG